MNQTYSNSLATSKRADGLITQITRALNIFALDVRSKMVDQDDLIDESIHIQDLIDELDTLGTDERSVIQFQSFLDSLDVG